MGAFSDCAYVTREVIESRLPDDPPTYAVGINVPVGRYAAANTLRALDEAFAGEAGGEGHLTVVPSIRAWSVSRRGTLGRASARVTLGLDFFAPSGERIEALAAQGEGVHSSTLPVYIFRLLVMLGTIGIFDSVDAHMVYVSMFEDAARNAGDALARQIAASQALREYALRIDDVRPGGLGARLDALLVEAIPADAGTVAVLEITPLRGESGDLEAYLGEELRTRLARRRPMGTVERARQAAVLEELQLSVSDLMAQGASRRFGDLVGAQVLLTGTISQFDRHFRLNLRAIDTETGLIIGSASSGLSRFAFGSVEASGERESRRPECPPVPNRIVLWGPETTDRSGAN